MLCCSTWPHYLENEFEEGKKNWSHSLCSPLLLFGQSTWPRPPGNVSVKNLFKFGKVGNRSWSLCLRSGDDAQQYFDGIIIIFTYLETKNIYMIRDFELSVGYGSECNWKQIEQNNFIHATTLTTIYSTTNGIDLMSKSAK